jgi:hypothetical protein
MPKGKLNPADKQFSDEELIDLFSEPPDIPERFSMALLFDEGVNQLAIPVLLERCARLNITTVQREGLAGEKSDYRLLAHARSIACTMIVDDDGYYLIIERLDSLNLNHAGVIFAESSTERGLQRLITFIETNYQQSIHKDMPDLLHYSIWEA